MGAPPKPRRTNKTVIVPKLYIEGLILATILFGLSLLSTTLKKPAETNAPSDLRAGTSTGALLSVPTDAKAVETWSVVEQPILENVTATSTIVLPDGTIALYETHDGTIWRRESRDGTSFSEPVSTGLTEDRSIPFGQRPVLGGPSVLQLSSAEFFMVFEQSVRQRPEVPQIDQPKNLAAATSSDGVTFQSAGLVLDSSRNDAGSATDPELVFMPDGSLQLFYVSKGDRVASLRSTDRGKTWVREGERLARVSRDPDVLYLGAHYAMYYSFPGEGITAEGELATGMRIRKAVSTDGLTFTKTAQTLVAGPNFLDTVDPDVIIEPNGTVRMYFGLRRPGTDVANPVYDLYTATAKAG